MPSGETFQGAGPRLLAYRMLGWMAERYYMKITGKLLVTLEAEAPATAQRDPLRQACSDSEEEAPYDRIWSIPVAQPLEKKESSCNTPPTKASATPGHSNY